MAVFRHRDKWKAVVWNDGKKIASKSGFSRKSDAKAWHDDTLRRIRQDGTIPESSPRFEDLVAKFREWHLPSVSPGTRAAYETDLRLRIEPFFRFRRIASITPADIEGFRAACQKTLTKPRSVNGATDVLRLLLNKAVRWRMLKESPFALEAPASSAGLRAADEQRTIRFLSPHFATVLYLPAPESPPRGKRANARETERKRSARNPPETRPILDTPRLVPQN